MKGNLDREQRAVENGERIITKKARVESPRSQAKQSEEQEEANGGGALVPVYGAAAKVEIMVRIKRAILHCPLCTLPFTPPICQVSTLPIKSTDSFSCIRITQKFEFFFSQCGVGHLACGPCHGQLPGKECRSCDGGDGGSGGAYARCFAMDAFVSSAVVPCPFEEYGCRSEVTYHEVAAHQRACPHAPCGCPEPCCAFDGSAATLAAHLAKPPHAWPVHKLRYGDVLRLRVPEAEPQRLFVAADEDGQVFVLAVGERDAASFVAVTVASIGAATGARYICKMWANGDVRPVTGKVERVIMENEVLSSSSGGVAADDEEVMYLGVPRKMLHGESKQIHLGVRINKLTRVST